MNVFIEEIWNILDSYLVESKKHPFLLPNCWWQVALVCQMARNQSFVVKPRHGSNSKHVTLWRPGEAGS